MTPPAPRPQSVRAAIKEPMLGAIAHQTRAIANTAVVASQTILRPMVSDKGANRGMGAVAEMMKAVDNHEAEFEELK